MSKPVKWILGIVLVLIILVVLIPLLLPMFVDPNDYKDTIAQKVEEQTGRTLTIPGDIELDFSLIGLNTVFKLGEVRLSSSPDFAGTEFFASDQVEVNLALWPLITDKELKINKIVLAGVNINLVKNKEGKGSWEDLAGQPSQKAPEKKEKPAAEPGGGLAAIDIGGIEARNINLTYTDNQADRTVKLSDLNLETGRIRQGNPFPFKASFGLFVQDAEQQPLAADFNISSQFTFFLEDQHFIIDGFSFEGMVEKSPFAPGKIDLGISADIDLALKKEKVDIKELVIRQGKMQIETVLALTGFADPQLKGSIKIPRFSPRNQAETFGVALPLEDPQSLANMSAQFDFSGNKTKLDINSIILNIDDTKVTGKAAVTDLQQPAYDLTLDIDQLDLDRYAMKKENGASPQPSQPAEMEPSQPGQPAGVEVEQPILPVEQLRTLNFNAAITMNRLKAAKLNMANLRINATGKDGLIRLNPFSADLYDGNIAVTADIDARPDVPVIKLNKTLQNVQLGPLFLDMTGKEEMKGKADIQADVTTRGAVVSDLKKNANGNMSLSIADGEIAKLKIIDTIRTAKALMGSKDEKQPAEKQGETKQQPAKTEDQPGGSTTFAALSATGLITNGVIKNDDLLAQSELMKVEGKGTVDLVNEQIDYLLTIYLAKSIDRNEETGLVDLADTPIPYRVKGSFDKISQSAALEEIIKAQGKKLLMNELEKQFGGDKEKKQEGGDGGQQESADPTKDLLKKGLKGLFGN